MIISFAPLVYAGPVELFGPEYSLVLWVVIITTFVVILTLVRLFFLMVRKKNYRAALILGLLILTPIIWYFVYAMGQSVL